MMSVTVKTIEAPSRDRDEELGPQMSDADLLEELVRKLLTEDFDQVRVEEKAGEHSSILTIHVATASRGRVIGAKGNNIMLLRDMFSLIGSCSNRRIMVELAGDHRGVANSAPDRDISRRRPR
jgi:predicted RNA-binding protein YlqC (UPF0109 family)